MQAKEFKIIQGKKAYTRHLRQAVALDSLVFEKEYVGTYSKCLNWFKRNPSIYTFLVDKHKCKVVGYINAMPISDNLFLNLLLEDVDDTNIDSQDIMIYQNDRTYTLYVSSLVIHPDYQNTKAFSLLYDAYMEELIRLSTKGIYIKQVIAKGVTKKGARICRLCGFKSTGPDIHGNEVYALYDTPNTFKPISSKGEEVKQIYSSNSTF